MVEIIFSYNQIETTIQANLDDSFNNIIQKYINKSQLDINNIYFVSNGQILSNNGKIINIMNESEKLYKKKVILVLSINSSIKIYNTNIIKSKDIICPICKEICTYIIHDHRIILYGCKKDHITTDIKLDDFNNTQNIDMSQIICDKCNNISKSNSFNNEFFICYECKMNLCPLCKSIHDKKHSIINYDDKNYICNKHKETFVKYCEDCKIDLCLSCINGHKNHKLISYEDELLDMKELRKKMDNLSKVINNFKKNLEEIINKFKKIQDNLDTFYNINNNIIKNYEINKNRNFNTLTSLKHINRSIEIEINKLTNDYNYGYNLNKLLYLYNEINDENLEIELKYKAIINNEKEENKKEKLRIFGNDFIKNNIYKCKIIYKDKEYGLCEYIDDIDNEYNNNDIITIKLKGYNNITNMSCIFNACKSLSSIPDLSKWNTSKINNMSNMFSGCKSISSLPDISKWNTLNVNDMSYIFGDCYSLTSLPDISKWNTSNVNDMAGIFGECKSLNSLPDISKWNTSNVNDMSWMFFHCEKLFSLPDISKWNTSNVKDMNHMFFGCKSLSLLPDLSKWDISKVNDISEMFSGCKIDLKIPTKFKNKGI